MLTALPIHIWDRELETRILIAALALNNRSDVILGHEYNISPLYKKISNIYHYGAGRPINVSPRTDEWYEPIVENNGHVGLVYEEGINDIFSPIASDSFVGINNRSIEALTTQYGWCIEELRLILSTIREKQLKKKIIEKYKIVGNPRFELQGSIGKDYFKDTAEGLKNIFGKYFLISDNFGATEIYGSKSPISIKRDVRQVANGEKADQINQRYMDVVDQINSSKVEFIKIINSIVQQFPSITFLFRPHPLADCSQWYSNLVKSRNLIILMRDSIEPYIFGSMGMIHAGCTTGIQSELASVETIDVTKLFKDHRAEAASSLMASYRPANGEELVQSINQIVKNNQVQERSIERNGNNIKDILSQNLNSLRLANMNQCLNDKISYPKASALYTLHKEIMSYTQKYKSNINDNLPLISQYVTSMPPNPIKARSYTIDDMQKRLMRAFRCLGLEGKIALKIYKPGPNTFYFQQYLN